MAQNDWTAAENRLIIADYFAMLEKELRHEDYNKTAHRRALMPLLNGRTDGSIERKHQNISAALISLSLPFISGYKPLGNVQGMLANMVVEHVAGNTSLDYIFEEFSKEAPLPPEVTSLNFASLLVPPPEPLPIPKNRPHTPVSRPLRKPNYLKIEQDNRNLGRSGEEMIYEYEKWWLRSRGKEKLADQIEWLSDVEGDGAGFDILSRFENGKDKYIEVKTTKLSAYTPFFFTKNEMEVSKANRDKYHLYRVFKFASAPAFFVKPGSFEEICSNYEATQFRGRI